MLHLTWPSVAALLGGRWADAGEFRLEGGGLKQCNGLWAYFVASAYNLLRMSKLIPMGATA